MSNSSDSPDERSGTLALTDGEVLGETDAMALTDGDKLGDARGLIGGTTCPKPRPFTEIIKCL